MTRARVLILSSIGAGLAYAAGIMALGTPPTADANGTEIVAWFSEHGANARIYAWSAALVALGLAVALSLVMTVMPKPHRYMFMIGAAGFAIEYSVQAWFWAGLSLHPDQLDPSVALAIFDVGLFVGPLLNGATTAMMGAFAALGMGRDPIVPRWLMWLSIVAFTEQLIETLTVFGMSGFWAPGGFMNIYVGGVIGFAWAAGLVYWAVKRLEAEAPMS